MTRIQQNSGLFQPAIQRQHIDRTKRTKIKKKTNGEKEKKLEKDGKGLLTSLFPFMGNTVSR
jgi:hypothetical protein